MACSDADFRSREAELIWLEPEPNFWVEPESNFRAGSSSYFDLNNRCCQNSLQKDDILRFSLGISETGRIFKHLLPLYTFRFLHCLKCKNLKFCNSTTAGAKNRNQIRLRDLKPEAGANLRMWRSYA